MPRSRDRAAPAPTPPADWEARAAAAAPWSARPGAPMSAHTALPRSPQDVFSFHALIRLLVFQTDLVHESVSTAICCFNVTVHGFVYALESSTVTSISRCPKSGRRMPSRTLRTHV